MMMSPFPSSGASASTTLSTTAAGTMTHTARGAGSLATRSAIVAAPEMPGPTAACTASACASNTTEATPARASRRTMLAPMRPIPIIPRFFMRTSSTIGLDHRRHLAQKVRRSHVPRLRLREGLLVPGPRVFDRALRAVAAQQREFARSQPAPDRRADALVAHRVNGAIDHREHSALVVGLGFEARA